VALAGPVTAARGEASGLPGIAWLLLLALVVLGAGIGLRDPWPADEPRFALIARDMVESGQWFFPRVAGVLYPDKPPVFFWLIASFYWLTGSLRVAFLLPSLLAALGTLWLVYDLGARLWGRRTGLYAAAALLVTLQFAAEARTAQIDTVLTFWTTLGLYGLCRHLLLGPQWRWYVAGFAAAGAGIITKGVGILPLLVLVPWALARVRGWKALPRFRGGWSWAAGPGAMLAVIGCWLAPMLLLVHLSGDPAYAAYRDEILFRQTAVRYADAWHHLKPFWYYLVEVIPVFWLPVSLALPWLVPAWRRDLRDRDARQLLLLGWIALVVLFFSVSPGKRGVYLLPAVPALALAVAPHARALLERPGVQRTGYAVLALGVAVLGLALLYFAAIAPEKAIALVEKYEIAPWKLLAALLAAGFAWLAAGPRRGMYSMAGWLLTFWLLYGLYAYPLLNRARSPASMMAKVGRLIGPDAALGLVAWKEQIVLHADRPIVHFGYRQYGNDAEMDDALRWLASGERRYLLLPGDALNECLVRSRLKHAGFIHRADWWLAGADAIEPECRSGSGG
jgi:4-amino-4-deoxy-L-arabinose transferase-like glycosyltransferase